MKKLLITNSKKLFYENGYFKTKITDITEISKISTGNFYNFFSSKEELLIEVIKYELSFYSSEIHSIKNSNQDFNWKMNQLVKSFLIFFKESPEFFLLLYRLDEKKEKLSKKAKNHLELVWIEPKKIFIDSIKKHTKIKESDLFLAESFFESQLKIYIESFFKDKKNNFASSVLISNNFKENTDKLSCIVNGICSSLNICTAPNKYDCTTNAYTKQYIQKKTNELTDNEVHFSLTRIRFEFSEESNHNFSIFFKESILRYFVSIMKKEFRDEDMIGKLNHNEFVFIAPKSSIDIFSLRVEDLMRDLAIKFPAFQREYIKFASTHVSDSLDHKINLDTLDDFLSFETNNINLDKKFWNSYTLDSSKSLFSS